MAMPAVVFKGICHSFNNGIQSIADFLFGPFRFGVRFAAINCSFFTEMIDRYLIARPGINR